MRPLGRQSWKLPKTTADDSATLAVAAWIHPEIQLRVQYTEV